MVSVLFECPKFVNNASAMLRTAEFFRVKMYVNRSQPHIDSISGYATRHIQMEPMDFRRWPGRIIATDSSFALHPKDIEWDMADLLVMGNERRGVSKEVLDRTSLRVGIPHLGHVTCLNVNAACAAILSIIDAKGQLHPGGPPSLTSRHMAPVEPMFAIPDWLPDATKRPPDIVATDGTI